MTSTIRGSDNFDSAGGNACKAWVNFNGTGTVSIKASYNVSSITDFGGTGEYGVNFTSALSDANYAAVATGGVGADGNCQASIERSRGKTTTMVGIETRTAAGAMSDADDVCVAIFR